MKEKIVPLMDRILIKIVKKETVSPGGIILPNNSKEKTDKGLIVELSNNIGAYCVVDADDNAIIDFKVGDTIIYDRYAGVPIKIEDDAFLLIKIDDILGRIEKV